MEKEQYRSVIRFLFLDGKTCEEIKTKLDAVCGNSSPSMTTVRYWFNEFKRGRSSVFDEERPGRPADVVTEEIVEKVHDMILADCRTKVGQLANERQNLPAENEALLQSSDSTTRRQCDVITAGCNNMYNFMQHTIGSYLSMGARALTNNAESNLRGCCKLL
ncbi:SETMR methyltransferase, partial [Acromyrmex charruanus]